MANDVEFKPYKVKIFSNSDDKPFGLTIKGKAKSFVSAHESLRKVLIKGKSLKILQREVKFADVDQTGRVLNTVVEVFDNVNNDRGHVEMKVYIPGHKKGKAVTIELRKLSVFSKQIVVGAE